MWGQPRAGSSPAPGTLKRIVLFLVSLVLVIGYILFVASRNYSYYLEANELVENSIKYENKRVKVSGVAFKIERGTRYAKFFISKDGKGVYVEYRGSIPDAFGEGIPVVVEGVYRNGKIDAKTLLTKCPSKYETVSR